ncbi:alkaline phosphatase D family protein [Solwaraspora sp. WMMA2080]|uniref:alkaline phosphatase D family protein n=1 Tax=unclassified Solwaraspora TaxID=2627926 RepID=UPI00248B4A75|nr:MULTISPECIES: alkaline phosphatase D family protein [unclassified Solwaraspora]WBB95439.1 alkaline phosphatase D family protein [Solwaraspora sp. WMMA2059]WBC20656.1 alkaline phosphatase D family protein [Solwaraspora sp. WMMA2080]
MNPFDRRTLLRAGLAGGTGLAGGALLGGAGAAASGPAASGRPAAPAWHPTGRPVLTHGVQSGVAGPGEAVVWTRADRVGRLIVEVGRRPDLRDARRVRGPVLDSRGDYTGKVRLRGLPAGERLHYRVRVESLHRPSLVSEPLTGSLSTAPRAGGHHGHHRGRPVGGTRGRVDNVRFVWTGDIAGQGWGISEDFGGMRIFEAMRRGRPDFFLCSGDTVYADNPLAETVTLPDGRVWRNLVTPEKSKVAETLTEFRGQFAYNLLDAQLRSFAAEVPQLNQWDDHEVTNNWYPGEILTDPRYTETRVDVLAARSRQAFHEWLPTPDDGPLYRVVRYGPLLDVFVLDMRTYKDPNDGNTYADPHRGLLGTQQRQWLIRELTRSTATWKVIANNLPLGLIVPDGGAAQEGIAQGDGGAPAGRELEFAEILGAAHRAGVTGIVFLTADVHYTAAHHYDPARAAVADFTPFWEFVSGPAHAGAFGPNTLDGTFGPEAVFVNAPPRVNTSPAEGFQHYGEVFVDGESRAFTVHLRDRDGRSLWSATLPAPSAR